MIEDIVGRYLHLDLNGERHRLYFEEAGQGIPLLCLHTAGSDGRQYRGLLNDKAVTEHFRCVVFDMPRHGKSSPPEGWWRDEYRLTTADYAGMVVQVAAALGLDRPVVMGCSIGGRIVLELAAEHASRLRGVIGLQSSAYVEGYYDLGWLHRPDVHGGEIAAGIVSGLMAPQSPETERWETLWHYMQGGPGIFRGDLHFYVDEGDLRSKLSRIDTARCPVWMLTGDYDYSCTPEASRQTAAGIAGADLSIMPKLGHFPMSENYELFRSHLLPVLAQVRARS
jgi:pimeloyl-ACP methyl ester carboxylesterase